ncbi:MAG TPA: hypothetical protein PLH37_03670 [bacterium]|nr:hypothetical protein [bacterium]
MFEKKLIKDKTKIKRLIGLMMYVFLACSIIFIIKPIYLISIAIVLLPTAVVNFLWLKKSRFKIFIFSIVSAIIFAPPVELAARLANAWDVQSVLPRPFGIMPLENILFAFLNFFWVLSFYEYFVDHDRKKKVSKKFKYLVGLYCLMAVIIFSLFFYNYNLVTLNYCVLSVPILILPSLIIFYSHPNLLKKTILPTLFFAIIFFVYETTSLIVGNWWWPGEYLINLNLLGHRFPLDDIVIWYFLSTPTLIGGYEFFMDDGK